MESKQTSWWHQHNLSVSFYKHCTEGLLQCILYTWNIPTRINSTIVSTLVQSILENKFYSHICGLLIHNSHFMRTICNAVSNNQGAVICLTTTLNCLNFNIALIVGFVAIICTESLPNQPIQMVSINLLLWLSHLFNYTDLHSYLSDSWW